MTNGNHLHVRTSVLLTLLRIVFAITVARSVDFPKHLQRSVTARRVLVRARSEVCNPDASRSATSSHGYVANERTYSLLRSPRSLKRTHDRMLQQQRMRCTIISRKLKVARRRLVRQTQRMASMADIIQQLRSQTDTNTVELIERCFGHIPAEMLKRKLTLSSKEPYSDDLRSFAMTLHFYSAKAYEFVRRSFQQACTPASFHVTSVVFCRRGKTWIYEGII